MCTNSLNAIKSFKSHHLILNKIYDLAAKLKKQEKQITLHKVPAHTGIVGKKIQVRLPKKQQQWYWNTTHTLHLKYLKNKK